MRSRSLTSLLGLAVAATCAFALPAEAAKRALLIGIGAYEHIQPLRGPARDVDRVEAFLTKHMGYETDEIAVLKDRRATRKNLLRAMDQWLVKSTKPGDEVFIYFSGHGSQLPDDNQDEKDGLDETLSPVNTTKTGENQITDDEFGSVLTRLAGRDVTVVVDSCHSGTISRSIAAAGGSADTPRTFTPVATSRSAGTSAGAVEAHRREVSFIESGKSLRIWSAAAANQFAWDTGAGGVFTRQFLKGAGEGAADRNGNGTVTNAELLNYLRDETSKYCATNPQCKPMGFTPTLEAQPRDMARAIVVVPAGSNSGSGAAVDPQKEVTEEHVQAATGTIKPDVATDILPQSNEADVEISMLPGGKLKLGQEFRISVSSGKPGYLVLLDINAHGQVTQLIPNNFMDQAGQTRFIRPRGRIVIPDDYYGFAFEAAEPAGHGTLVAIVTEDEVALKSLLDQHRAIEVVAAPTDFLADLAHKLMAIWNGDEKNRPANWSLATLKYEIK
ncbi:MAG: caspase family protein [Pseudomonadota bacterium]